MDITEKAIVKKFIEEINLPQNIDRKEYVAESHSILDGNLMHFVKDRLRQLWPETSKWFRVSNTSLTKKVNQRLNKAYNETPLRVLDSEVETTQYQELLKLGGISNSMRTFDSWFILDRYACVWVDLIDHEEMKFIFRPLYQSQFDRVVNKKTLETEVFIVSMPRQDILPQIHGDNQPTWIQDESEDADEVNFYAMWTKENHVVVAERVGKEGQLEVEILQVGDNVDHENKLGMIPAAFAQSGDEFSVPVRNALPYNDVEINACKSIMLTGCDVQALGKLIIKHPSSQKLPKDFLDSPFTHYTLPQSEKPNAPSTEAEFISPSPNIEAFQKVIHDYESSIYEEEGISTQAIGDARFTSGMDRAIAMKSEMEKVQSNQDAYVRVEENIYLIVQAFHTAMEDNRFKSKSIKILFPKMQPIKSRTEILDEIEREVKLGTIEPWEKHIKLNPNLTEEQARDKEDTIQKSRINNALRGFGGTEEE